MSVLELRKIVLPEIVFGENSIKLLSRYLTNFSASKVLLVTDPGVIEAGWSKIVEQDLNKAGIKYAVFSHVSPNPRSKEVMEGAEVYLKEKCSAIVAVGGGSPMDCAKGIGIITANGGKIADYEGVDMVLHPIPLLICIPTTAGTSADVSQFAIIALEDEKRKIAIVSKTVVPDVSLIDPATLVTMPAFLSACTGLDALTHAVEAYFSNASSCATDINAMKAIELINSFLAKTIQEPGNIEYRGQVMMASMLAGMAFSNASLGAVHAMAHALGGVYDLPHGECNAILLDKVMEYNADAVEIKFSNLSHLLNLTGRSEKFSVIKQAILDHINELKHSVGISHGLSHFGINKSNIEGLIPKAMIDPCIVTNPKNPTATDIGELYERSI